MVKIDINYRCTHEGLVVYKDENGIIHIMAMKRWM